MNPPRRLVVDPSAILALVLADEDPEVALQVLQRIGRRQALTPPLFWFELRNVLVVNERRGRLSPAETDDFLRTFATLPLEVAPLPHDLAVLTLAREHDLTIYDAAYLELASRTGSELATLDKKLQRAAVAVGVPLWPEG